MIQLIELQSWKTKYADLFFEVPAVNDIVYIWHLSNGGQHATLFLRY